MLIDHRVAQLLCSRLCHDLAGPAGAVGTGLELVDEGADEAAEALALVAKSARQVIARLSFYRIAFGSVGATAAIDLSELRDLTFGHLSGGLVIVDWPPDEGPIGAMRVAAPGPMLLLNLVVMGVEALPRGGALQMRFATVGNDLGVAITAKGRGAVFKPDQREAMLPEASVEALTARTAPAYCVSQIAADLGITIEISEGDTDEVRIAAILPGA
jgi:histidine phosphotransferase ChpT